MALKSRLFAGNAALEAAAQDNPAHIRQGAAGIHVSKIQGALQALDGATIAESEITARSYGASTAAAVLAYKTRRAIINRSYQQTADNVTGIMTVARMDEELVAMERPVAGAAHRHVCGRGIQLPCHDGGAYESGLSPMSGAEMIALLEGGSSPQSRTLVADLKGRGRNGPLVASGQPRMPGFGSVRRG